MSISELAPPRSPINPRRESEEVLFARYHATRDPRDREQLVHRFLPFARRLTVRYRHTQEPSDDLLQVASIGLLKAIDRFDPARGKRFTSYAAPTILGELKRHFRDKGWAVHVPRDLQERALAVQKMSERLSHDEGRSPTMPELAAALGLTLEATLEAHEAARSYRAASLDVPTGEGEHSSSLVDHLVSDDDEIAAAEQRRAIAEGWQQLSDVERRVVALRCVDDLSQTEIAARVGYSQMHVSRLLRRSMQRLLAPAS